MSIRENITAIGERIEQAARRSGRDPDSVALMAVSKNMPAEKIREAYAAGHRLFGENRVQEFADKSGHLADLVDAEFHLIGHLQSNKSAKAAALFHAVDSVDSLRVAERLDASAAAVNKKLWVLIEVNVGGETAKSGLAMQSTELEELLLAAPRLRSVEIRGLMAVPPFTEDPEGARPYFRALRLLRDQMSARNLLALKMDQLSMGMSHDFEVAIEEGSTCVRIGTAIFGERPAK